MASRTPSSADRQVIEAAAAVAVTVTAAQLERWRQSELIPRTEQRSQGRGRGKSSRYSAEAVDYIVRFAAHATDRPPLRAIPAAMFAAGEDVPDLALRSSYRQLLDSIETEIAKPSDGDARDHAEAVARRLQRRPGPGLRAERGRRRRQLKSLTIPDAATGQLDTPSFQGYEESLIINNILAVLAPDVMAADGVYEVAHDFQDEVRRHMETYAIEVPEPSDDDFLDALSTRFSSYTLDELRRTADRAPLPVLRASLNCIGQVLPLLAVPKGHTCDDPWQLFLPLISAIFFREILRSIHENAALDWEDMELLI